MSTYPNTTATNRCNRRPQEGIHQQSIIHGGENKTKKHETFVSNKKRNRKSNNQQQNKFKKHNQPSMMSTYRKWI